MCEKCNVAHATNPRKSRTERAKEKALRAITHVMPIDKKVPSIVDKHFGVPLRNREFTGIMQGAYKTRKRNRTLEHALLYKGDIEHITPDSEVLIRVNSSCFTGDIFHDESCDCNWQLWESLRLVEKWDGVGFVIYHFADEGKAHGYLNKLRAYDPETGMYPVRGDHRDFTHAVAILKDLGVHKVRLMTNNPNKREALEKFGFIVTGTEHVVSKDPKDANFLKWKAANLGHEISVESVQPTSAEGEVALLKEPIGTVVIEPSKGSK